MLQLDNNWQLSPIPGETGQSFIGIKGDERAFIKKNTTPLLATLAKEAITPRLLWTKRAPSGDILSAQEWVDGKILTAGEIVNFIEIPEILAHLHSSSTLLSMAQKLNISVKSPEVLYNEFVMQADLKLLNNGYLTKVIDELRTFPAFSRHDFSLIHGDVNHRNWIISGNHVYLVDWDRACIGDKLCDISYLLTHYIDKKYWKQWFYAYGKNLNAEVYPVFKWYAELNFLNQVHQFYAAGDNYRFNRELALLKKLRDE
ncbi:MAG: phosphotransferase family protein [Streptococcaceae bacterium]|jgi:thiamine kinase-like enzyme|nr:phosphotransferase family protein [Streptococcaceae bacterium]